MSAYVLIPLIIPLIAIFVIFLLINRKAKSSLRKKGIYVTLTGYICILLLALGVYLYLPKEEYPTTGDIEQSEEPNLYLMAEEGKFSEIEDFKVKSWEFSRTKDRLEILLKYIVGEGPEVFVEKVDTDSITVDLYRSRSILNGRHDITDEIPVPKVDLTSDMLVITQQEAQLKFYGFNNEFPIEQFSDAHFDPGNLGSSFGGNVVYIRVPEDLNVVYDNQNDFGIRMIVR
ncbi:hypothetical protein [Ornithinibacillus halophilus]|uniref:Uncharacterized protein n=1 Tax=Ornithinibacillus halophilus TaxID=930117 RepID=A0A1M5KYA5_9BACI|nr:hypothetical protein [Ornithinibacillus halophilus]SHG57650.1 hypothetical protein SAMN05216225_104222 [Ornithinibacillus halophilus]